jgi:hypothetical protein
VDGDVGVVEQLVELIGPAFDDRPVPVTVGGKDCRLDVDAVLSHGGHFGSEVGRLGGV